MNFVETRTPPAAKNAGFIGFSMPVRHFAWPMAARMG
jgi:hypothetical protein